MKWSTKQAQSNLKNPSNLPQIVLAYGDDGGQARSLISTALTASGIAADDPFLFTSIDITDLTQESGRLLEAAQTISFGGGLKVIRIDGITPDMGAPAQAALTGAVKSCLAADLKDVLILIAAPGLDAKTALVRNTEKAANAAAIRCFQASIADLRTHIQSFAAASQKTIAPDALLWLQENLGSDQAITQSELDKLLIYIGDKTDITLNDCLAITAGAPAVNVFTLCDAVGSKNLASVDKALSALLDAGEDINMIFALVVRHLRRICQAQEAVAAGVSPQNALKTLTPPVLFNQNGFLAQMNTLNPRKAAKITSSALKAQQQSRTGILPPELVLSRAILSFAA